MPTTEPTRSQAPVDAELFLRLSDMLKATHHRLTRAKVSSQRRARWRRRLIAIANTAKLDLSEADVQLMRFAAELDRELGAGSRQTARR